MRISLRNGVCAVARGLLALALVAAAGAADGVETVRREVKVALIGEALPANRKGEDFPVERMIAYWTEAMDREIAHHPDLVVLPEISDVWSNLPRDRRVAWLEKRGTRVLDAWRAYARAHACYLVYPTYRKTASGAWANTAYLIDRAGEVVGHYDKYQPTVRDLCNPDMKVVPGRRPFVAETDFGRVGILICFDINFQEIFDLYAREEVDVLVFPSYYDGGYFRSSWASRCGAWLVASTVGRLSKTVTDPAGHETARADDPVRTLTAPINTNCRVIHADFNLDKVAVARAKYGDRLVLSARQPDSLYVLASRDPSLRIDDVLAEFGIESWRAYAARSRAARDARLAEPDAAAPAASAPLRAALYVDAGCRGSGLIRWAEILRDSPDADFRMVDGADIRAGALDDRELLVMPGGLGGPQYAALGDAGAERLRAFVANGGRYFGTCCGLAIALNEDPGFAKRLKMLPFRRSGGGVRGGFTATVRLNARGAAWLGVRAGDWNIRYHNGPVVVPTDPVPLCSDVEVLATMNCELNQNGRVSAPMYGTPAAVRARYGKGEMLAFNCHPESFPQSRELIVAGIRALTGHALRLVPQPLKPRGAERVGYFVGELGSKASLDRYFALRADPDVDVVPVTRDELEEGAAARFDRIER